MDGERKRVFGASGGAEAAEGFFLLDRFKAFSNGVFAIVIALLVLELPIPPGTEPVLPALAG
jgi:uncharacterized membrane protein